MCHPLSWAIHYKATLFTSKVMALRRRGTDAKEIYSHCKIYAAVGSTSGIWTILFFFFSPSFILLLPQCSCYQLHKQVHHTSFCPLQATRMRHWNLAMPSLCTMSQAGMKAWGSCFCISCFLLGYQVDTLWVLMHRWAEIHGCWKDCLKNSQNRSC